MTAGDPIMTPAWEPLPCPFCGSTLELDSLEGAGGGEYRHDTGIDCLLDGERITDVPAVEPTRQEGR